ncbi:MAG: hypothetical protein ACYTE8_05490 [Planctomycetota bacterium]|jgi:hypothetical protein
MNSQQKLLTIMTLLVVSLLVTPAFAHTTYSYSPSGIWVPDSHVQHSEPEAQHQQAAENPGPLEGAFELAGGALKLVADTTGGIVDAIGGLFKADNKAAEG